MVLLSLSSGSTRCGPRWGCCIEGIILYCNDVTLKGTAGFRGSSGGSERNPWSSDRGSLWFDKGGIKDGGEFLDSNELGVTKLGEWCCRNRI